MHARCIGCPDAYRYGASGFCIDGSQGFCRKAEWIGSALLATAVAAAVALAFVAADDGALARAAAVAGLEPTRVLGVVASVKAALAAGALWWADRGPCHPAAPIVTGA